MVGPLEYGFQGLPQDPETGFVYFRNRYYDPQIGHFISADPLGYVDGPSEYAFEKDDPINGRDPLGLCLGLGDYPCSYYADKAAAKLHGFKKHLDAGEGVAGIAANTIAGTAVDATELFLVDPLRAGQASGDAIGSGASAGNVALAIVQDAGRVATLVAPTAPGIRALARIVPSASRAVGGVGRAARAAAVSDEAFVRFDPSSFDSSISSLGVQQRFFGDGKIGLTKYKDIKPIVDPAKLEEVLYRQNLWSATRGKFSGGATLREVKNVTDAVPAGVTNKANGVRQWRLTRDLPASDLGVIRKLDP